MSLGVAIHEPAPPSVSMYVRPGSDAWSTSSGPTSNVDASRIPAMPSGVSSRSYTACSYVVPVTSSMSMPSTQKFMLL